MRKREESRSSSRASGKRWKRCGSKRNVLIVEGSLITFLQCAINAERRTARIDRSVADEQIIEFRKKTGEERYKEERFAIRKRFTLRTKEELHDPLKES